MIIISPFMNSEDCIVDTSSSIPLDMVESLLCAVYVGVYFLYLGVVTYGFDTFATFPYWCACTCFCRGVVVVVDDSPNELYGRHAS